MGLAITSRVKLSRLVMAFFTIASTAGDAAQISLRWGVVLGSVGDERLTAGFHHSSPRW